MPRKEQINQEEESGKGKEEDWGEVLQRVCDGLSGWLEEKLHQDI